MQQEVKTKKLELKLRHAESLEDFFEENEQNLKAKTVSEYLEELLIKYKAGKGDIVKKAGLTGTYGYQIFDGTRSAGRDKLIQLAFGFPLKVEETQRLLRCGGYAELYVKKRREAFLIYALEKGYDITRVNELLYENDEKTLG